MEEKREPESFMMRVARFIVNKRKAFIALFILACIYSVLSTVSYTHLTLPTTSRG